MTEFVIYSGADMMKEILTRVLVMRPGKPDEMQEHQLARAPGYKRLADLIEPLLDGASLEHVNVWADFARGDRYGALDMFVDGEGLLGLSAAPKAPDPEMLSFIAGPAILFDRRVWF